MLDSEWTRKSDEELLRLWFQGEAAAFDEFYRRHAPRVVAYARRKGLADAADDVAQDAFLRLHRNLEHYDDTRPALPWFFSIVHSCSIDALRQANRLRQKSEALAATAATGTTISTSAEADTSATESEFQTLVHRANSHLSPEQRRLITMRVDDDLSFKEISARTGKSEVSLRKAYERAVGKLRDWLTGGSHDG